ncbi:hypothetical protein FOA52_015243 [Chlamydomonas sp. UWO 241]|nr:hypothetical protein FOA52_015243 [Chlamydomonas sp. UWO 241]
MAVHGRGSARRMGPPAVLGGSGGKGPGGSGRGSVRVASGGGDGGEGSAKSVGVWGAYLRALEKFPLLTKAATCGILNALGDVLAQLVVEKSGTINVQRTATFAAIGFMLTGPLITYWYDLLARLMPSSMGATSTLMSLAIDQLLFAPTCIAAFFGLINVIEGKPDMIVPKLKADLWEAVKANWLLWVPAQAINFSVVPLPLRAPFVSVVALAWNVYLSWSSHKPIEGAATGH